MKNGKKKITLIALLSCVLTATVAFAAYTGFNYINGTVEVVGNPFKMVFATINGTTVTPIEGAGTINAETTQGGAAGHAAITGEATATDLSVTAFDTNTNSHIIDSFTVTLNKKDDSVVYTFAISNIGGSTAYLNGIVIESFDMPTDAASAAVRGLTYSVDVGGNTVTSTNGESASLASVTSLPVEDGSDTTVKLTITATDNNLFTAWTPDDPNTTDTDEGKYGATIELGKVTITWSAVPPTGTNP